MRAVSQTFLALAVLAGLLPACKRGASPSGADAGTHAEAPRPVQTANATPFPFPRMIVLHGQLEANEAVQIAARIEGPIERVNADLGDHVRAGGSLAQIVPTDFRAKVMQTEAQLAQARSDLARLEGLERPESIAAQQIEQARTQVAVAQANLDLANRQFHDASIRAPFDGIVARRYVARGAFVRIGTQLFDFVSDGPMRLSLEVPENFVRDVHEGLTIRVLPEASAGEGFAAQVVRIGPVITTGTRTFRIEARVDPHEGQLRPGMFVLGTLELGTDADAVRIARGAVYSVLGQDRVTLVVNGRAEYRDVQLLGERGGDAIVHGLRPSDVVVVRGGGSLAPGAPVRIAEATAGAAPAADAGRGR